MCLTVKDEIDGVIFELDRALSRRPGETDAKAAFTNLCWESARWVRNVYGAPQTRSAGDFWDRFTADRSALGAAWQVKEISERTEIAGTVAHRWSAFGWRPSPEAPWAGRGIRSLQLLKVPGRWAVAAALWIEEADGGLIPPRYFEPS